MINISQQALALHFTFLQNALRDGKWHFTSSLISSILRVHTSQPSLVSLLLFPRQMERMLLAIPQMAQICKLISSLPMMRVSPSWPTHLLTMLPARRLLLKPLQVPSNRNLDLSLLTSEIIHWSDHFGTLLPKTRSQILSRKAKQLHRQWIRRELHPVPALAHQGSKF
jgi:hypothetical protein